MGLMHGLVVHPADIQDRDGAKLVLDPLIGRMPRLERIWADAGYGGTLVDWVRQEAGWTLEVVAKPPGATTFVRLPHRWIVERTFAWLGKCRRLSKEYDHLPASSAAFIRLAMIRLMLRRLQPAS
jgi:putative transposase